MVPKPVLLATHLQRLDRMGLGCRKFIARNGHYLGMLQVLQEAACKSAAERDFAF